MWVQWPPRVKRHPRKQFQKTTTLFYQKYNKISENITSYLLLLCFDMCFVKCFDLQSHHTCHNWTVATTAVLSSLSMRATWWLNLCSPAWLIKSAYLINTQHSFLTLTWTGTSRVSSQHTWHMLMFITDALCVQRWGVVQQFPALRPRGLRIQEGETKITKPLGVINGGMCWESHAHSWNRGEDASSVCTWFVNQWLEASFITILEVRLHENNSSPPWSYYFPHDILRIFFY